MSSTAFSIMVSFRTARRAISDGNPFGSLPLATASVIALPKDRITSQTFLYHAMIQSSTGRAYQPPPPPPPPPPPEEPPLEKPEEEEDLGCGRVEEMVEAMEEEKPPMRSPKLSKPPPWYQAAV